MNDTVPNAKNWPDKDRIKKQLAAKRSRIIPIACGTDIDAEGALLRLTRKFQKDDPGRLVGFVAALMYRGKNGEIQVMNSAHGKIGLEGQIMLARKLTRWIEL